VMGSVCGLPNVRAPGQEFMATFRLSVRRILDLDPVRAPPGAIGPVAPLRDDTLRAQRAGVAEDGLTVAVEVLGQADAGTGFAQQPGQGRAPDFPWMPAQVLAVEREQVEGIGRPRESRRARLMRSAAAQNQSRPGRHRRRLRRRVRPRILAARAWLPRSPAPCRSSPCRDG